MPSCHVLRGAPPSLSTISAACSHRFAQLHQFDQPLQYFTILFMEERAWELPNKTGRMGGIGEILCVCMRACVCVCVCVCVLAGQRGKWGKWGKGRGQRGRTVAFGSCLVIVGRTRPLSAAEASTPKNEKSVPGKKTQGVRGLSEECFFLSRGNTMITSTVWHTTSTIHGTRLQYTFSTLRREGSRRRRGRPLLPRSPGLGSCPAATGYGRRCSWSFLIEAAYCWGESPNKINGNVNQKGPRRGSRRGIIKSRHQSPPHGISYFTDREAGRNILTRRDPVNYPAGCIVGTMAVSVPCRYNTCLEDAKEDCMRPHTFVYRGRYKPPKQTKAFIAVAEQCGGRGECGKRVHNTRRGGARHTLGGPVRPPRAMAKVSTAPAGQSFWCGGRHSSMPVLLPNRHTKEYIRSKQGISTHTAWR